VVPQSGRPHVNDGIFFIAGLHPCAKQWIVRIDFQVLLAACRKHRKTDHECGQTAFYTIKYHSFIGYFYGVDVNHQPFATLVSSPLAFQRTPATEKDSEHRFLHIMLLHFEEFPNFVVDMTAKSDADNSLSDSTDDTSLRLLFNDIFQSYEQPLFRLAANLCKDDTMARD